MSYRRYFHLSFPLARTCALLLVYLGCPKLLEAQTLTTVVNFNGTNGSSPEAALILGSDGNFYGSTNSNSDGYSTIFQLTPSGTLTTLFNCNSTTGSGIVGAFLQAAGNGNLLGTTASGGSSNGGTIFQTTTSGTLTTLFNFNGTNGYSPAAALIKASDGNYYGTTTEGGTTFVSSDSPGFGTVFRLTPGGSLTTLVNFTGANGRFPFAALIQGIDGNFYGTTLQGGSSNDGTVFRLTPDGSLTTLVNFTGSNGRSPFATLIQATDGNFYGTTAAGGTAFSGIGSTGDYGTVFQLTPAGTLTTLVSFNHYDGSGPKGALVQGTDGNFYGTTAAGGGSTIGNGEAFRMTPSGTLAVMLYFNSSNGASPAAALLQGSDGSLYGTTTTGGPANDGTLFQIGLAGTVDQSPFNGTYVGFNYFSLPGFGFYNEQFYPWVYQTDIGFTYFDVVDANDMYLYNEGVQLGWLYTSPSLLPNMYSFHDGSWLYFFPGATTQNFYNYTSGQFETHHL